MFKTLQQLTCFVLFANDINIIFMIDSSQEIRPHLKLQCRLKMNKHQCWMFVSTYTVFTCPRISICCHVNIHLLVYILAIFPLFTMIVLYWRKPQISRAMQRHCTCWFYRKGCWNEIDPSEMSPVHSIQVTMESNNQDKCTRHYLTN